MKSQETLEEHVQLLEKERIKQVKELNMSSLIIFRRYLMNRQIIEQEFYTIYGYYPDEQNLQEFLEEHGYNDYNPYNSNTTRNSRKSSFDFNDDTDYNTNNVSDEFQSIFKDILRNSTSHKHSDNDNAIINEFAFMSLIFLTKASLFFLLRYCKEQGYYTDL